MSLWRRIKREFKKRWASIIGMLASIATFIYNLYRPTRFLFFGQSAVAGGVPASPFSVSLGVVSLIVLAGFLGLYIYQYKTEARR